MSKNIRKIQTYLYSFLGVVVTAVLVVAINIIASQIHRRVDFTEDRLYTLSEGSKQILAKLKSPIAIRLYCTRADNAMPVHLRGFARRVEDLLKEYAIAAGGKIRIDKLDPIPDSDAEDAAALDGIDGQATQTGEKIYLGLAVTCIDQTQSIPFLSPNNENTLEYDITRLILRVGNPAKITVGIMSSMPVMSPPEMPGRPPRREDANPWLFVTELKKDYEVRDIAKDVGVIPDDVNILVVIHPRDLADKTLFALDQFVLRGGKLIAFVDPMSAIEAQFPSDDPTKPPTPGSSTLKPLFDAWGVEFDTTKILIDMKYPTEIGGAGGDRQQSAAVLSYDNRRMNASDIISGGLDKIIFAYGGAFTGQPAEGLTKTALITSSDESQLVSSYKAQMPEAALAKEFKSDDKEYALAVRLVGTFKTAFPNGKPKASDEKEEDEKKDESPAEVLTASADTGAVILVGDADMIYDDFWVRKMSFLGAPIHQVFGDNNNFLQNCVEQLSGDNSLISIRSRGITNRPFLVVKDMQLEAEKKYKQEISDLETELSDAQRKIGELQRTKKDQDQRYILSTEQMQELERFQEKQVDVRKRLKELRKQLRKDVDNLETTLKWCNIGLMPVVVALSGILFAMIRRNKTGAR